ncbi:MAG TPA: ABC transporter substrate-binding protein [Candidatus Saccharimonadales bacterium]|nr:ABC transporter substrate-binding protein [Candidatus Saccharimonadales bacterium]
MSTFLAARRSAVWILILIGILCLKASQVSAQTTMKKVRVSIPGANVTYLPFYAAKDKGYYKEESLDIEFILMPASLASTAVLTGDIDYNGAVTGVVAAAVRGQPIKAVIFTMRSPVQGLMAKPDIKDLQQLKGRKIGVSSPGSTTDLSTRHILRRQGFEFGRDYSIVYIATEPGRLAALETGVLDAAMLSVPENIIARQRGFNELALSADFMEFPQNGFGASNKKIKENPEEITRMVRATLRGLVFVSDNKNKDACLDIIMKNWGIKSRAMASEMYDYMAKAMLRDASISMNGLQALVDQQRESAKVTEPVNAAQVIDYSFVERVRKELGMGRQ